jgi:hypothetical protein
MVQNSLVNDPVYRRLVEYQEEDVAVDCWGTRWTFGVYALVLLLHYEDDERHWVFLSLCWTGR